MNIATWNVNSLNVRLPQVLRWLTEHPVDVLCVQETKLTDDRFPVHVFQEAGYHLAFSGQKTYNGVAILARTPITDVRIGLPNLDDEQKRVIAGTVAGLRVVCAYFPNGQAPDSDKFTYKLRWLSALHDWLADELARCPMLALLGDFNIAPEDRDVHDPSAWTGMNLVSPEERAAWRDLCGLGLNDAFRQFEQPEKSYSWWDYRALGFRLNKGMRIDHILLATPLLARLQACQIDRNPRGWPQPSDHAPVRATLSDG